MLKIFSRIIAALIGRIGRPKPPLEKITAEPAAPKLPPVLPPADGGVIPEGPNDQYHLQPGT